MKFLLVFSMLIFGICTCWEDVPRFFTNGHAGHQFYHAREEPKEPKLLKLPQKQDDNKVEDDVQTADSIIRKNYVLPPRSERPKKVIKVYRRKLSKKPKIESKIVKVSTQTKRELYARKPSDKFMKLHRNSKNTTRPQRHIPYYFRRQGLYL